ncbi:MAG TPA: rhomboid family intramembrane serine protease [Dehalococcoidia bacterium]
MIPVGDFLRRRTTPYVNWALIAVNIGVFLYTLTLSTRPDAFLPLSQPLATSEADRFYFDWGFEPACIADYLGLSTDASARDLRAVCPAGDRELLQVFTSMFVQAGWAHILGNMLFLWIFGDNVEDRVGHGRYLVFYLLSGIAAAAAQTFMAADTVLPAVGASGAIAGVLGAYLLMYPRAIVQVVILPFFFIPFFVPAVFLIGIWFLTQLFAGVAEIGQSTAGSGVAWWAHVGGFVAGAVLIWFFKRPTRPRPAPFS